jgi:hypothetical protein
MDVDVECHVITLFLSFSIDNFSWMIQHLTESTDTRPSTIDDQHFLFLYRNTFPNRLKLDHRSLMISIGD